jgi:hypothetical protein
VSRSLQTFLAAALFLNCVLLGFAGRASAQDRGAPFRGEDFGNPDSSKADEDTSTEPRARRNDDGESPYPRRRTRRGDQPASATSDRDERPRSNNVDSRDSGYRARRQADLQEGESRPRVRHRADFDGPEWDASANVQEPANPSDLSGAFHMGLELTLLGFESLSLDQSGPLTIGVNRTLASYGLTQGAGIGALVGLGLSDNFVLNGRLTFSNTTTSFGDSDSSDQLRFQISPNLEYVFGEPSAGVRPFLALLAGLLVGDTPAGPFNVSEVSFLFAGQLGLHLFPAKHISFDPALLIGYRVGSASTDSNAAAGAGIDYSISGLVLLLSFGVSYWS